MQPSESSFIRHHHRRRQRRSFHLSHAINTTLINLLAVASLFTGIWLSMQSGDWQWFSRSGSLLVVLGILLTSSQIIENSKRLKQRKLQHESNFKHDYAGDLKQHRLEHASMLEEDIWHNGLRGLYLLVTGTLIWGFGDLAGQLL